MPFPLVQKPSNYHQKKKRRLYHQCTYFNWLSTSDSFKLWVPSRHSNDVAFLIYSAAFLWHGIFIMTRKYIPSSDAVHIFFYSTNSLSKLFWNKHGLDQTIVGNDDWGQTISISFTILSVSITERWIPWEIQQLFWFSTLHDIHHVLDSSSTILISVFRSSYCTSVKAVPFPGWWSSYNCSSSNFLDLVSDHFIIEGTPQVVFEYPIPAETRDVYFPIASFGGLLWNGMTPQNNAKTEVIKAMNHFWFPGFKIWKVSRCIWYTW